MRRGWAAVVLLTSVGALSGIKRGEGQTVQGEKQEGPFVSPATVGRLRMASLLLEKGPARSAAQNGHVPNATNRNDATQEQANPSSIERSSFLIARRELDDPLFGKAVILMLPMVDKDVVVGLIVNRPTKITMHKLFPKIAAYKDGTAVAYFGGPVDVKTAGVLFRSTKAYKDVFHLTGDLYVTFNADQIEKVLKKPKEVSDVRFLLGRSQWGPDQLAGEMERGSWFGEKEANSVIFRQDSTNVWIELIGVLEPGSLAKLEGRESAAPRNDREFEQ